VDEMWGEFQNPEEEERHPLEVIPRKQGKTVPEGNREREREILCVCVCVCVCARARDETVICKV
jgi:hypothetical protein